jgi:transposase
MTIYMPQNITEERFRWITPLLEEKMKIKDLARICPHSERSLKRWLHSYRKNGKTGLTPKSTRPKTQPKETPIWMKELILEKRKQTKLCAQKIHWKLKKEGLNIHTRTIGKILKSEGIVRKYRVKKIKYKYIKAERQPGELVEIDVKYVPGKVARRRYFQYTAIFN